MAHLPPPTTAPAGWYPDPSGVGHRYFDGHAWATGHPGFAEPEEHPSLPLSAALGALVVLVVSLIAGKSLVDWLTRFDWPVIAYVVILAVIGYGPSLAWGGYVRRHWGAQEFRSLGWRFRWSDLGWGPLTWIAAVGTQLVLAAIVLVFDIPLSSNVDSAADLDTDRAYLIATLVTAVIAAPIIEELVFRGLVLRGLLSRMGPALAIAAAGRAVRRRPRRSRAWRGQHRARASCCPAWAWRSGCRAYLARRLGPTVIAHAIFNGVVMAIVLSGVLDDVETDFGAARPAAVTDPVARCRSAARRRTRRRSARRWEVRPARPARG